MGCGRGKKDSSESLADGFHEVHLTVVSWKKVSVKSHRGVDVVSKGEGVCASVSTRMDTASRKGLLHLYRYRSEPLR